MQLVSHKELLMTVYSEMLANLMKKPLENRGPNLRVIQLHPSSRQQLCKVLIKPFIEYQGSG